MSDKKKAPPPEKMKNIEDVKKEEKNTTPFWTENPNIILESYNLFPTSERTTVENLNALTRLVLLMMIVFLVLYRRVTVVLVSAICVFFIYVYYRFYIYKKEESFKNLRDELDTLETVLYNDLFDSPSYMNPFSNVLNSDIEDNPSKMPAPPVEDLKVQESIIENAKTAMRINNPTFPDIDKRLLSNMGDMYEFERSLQPFYTNAATTTPNDQNAFADFCYGSMISCKEGNLFACARNNEEASHYMKY